MVRRSSRLSGLNGSKLRPENRLDVVPVYAPAGAVDVPPVSDVVPKRRSSPFHLVVSLVSPDQAMIDLYDGKRLMYTVSKVEVTDLNDTDIDEMGRILPKTVWRALEDAKKSLAETPAQDARLPLKSEIFGASYLDYSAHPR